MIITTITHEIINKITGTKDSISVIFSSSPIIDKISSPKL